MEILTKIARGEDPRERPEAAQKPERVEPTLREASARYRDAHLKRKGRGARTIENYQDHVGRLMEDWQDRTLADLGSDPQFGIRRHERLSKANGPYIANGCMRTLRAIYNHARKGCRSLPPEKPLNSINWNKEERRDTVLRLADLKEWFGQAAVLESRPGESGR